jgi:predicted ATP-grasp superfamily ATP-dependent carboligase
VRTFLVDSELSIGRFSRYRGGYATAPPAGAEDGTALVDFLLMLAEREGLRDWVLFPTSDEIVRALSLGKARLEPTYRVPVSDWETIRLFAEKRETHELAARLGIPTPRTRYPRTGEDLAALDVPYPVVVKPLSRDPFYARTRRKAVRADDERELAEVWEWACTVVPPSELMVQELIPGGAAVLYSLGCQFFGGRLRGHVVAHRARQHPMDFGRATTLAETVDIPELEALGAKLLLAAGYEGLAEVEFMLDTRDNTYKLLEVNPRVWGWHTLAGRAGVDLPFLFYQDVIGEPRADAGAFEKGVKWLRPITDVPTALKEVLNHRLGVREYFSSIRGPKELAPAPSWDDPLPFAVEFFLIPYLWYKRGF